MVIDLLDKAYVCPFYSTDVLGECDEDFIEVYKRL